MNTPVTPEDHDLAAQLAGRAGSLLMELRARLAAEEAPSAVLKAEGDRQANELLMAALAEQRPDDAVLSEEVKDDHARLTSARTWIVDPLDGTREFSEPPRIDWAVHVALVVDGRPVAGAVALPALDLVLSTAAPARHDTGSEAHHGSSSAAPVRRPRPSPSPSSSAGCSSRWARPGRRPWPSFGVDVDIYVHNGGQFEWDSCAPVAVALAAGLHCSRIDGSPLQYNRPDPYLPDLLICRPELATRVLDVLAGLAQT